MKPAVENSRKKKLSLLLLLVRKILWPSNHRKTKPDKQSCVLFCTSKEKTSSKARLPLPKRNDFLFCSLWKQWKLASPGQHAIATWLHSGFASAATSDKTESIKRLTFDSVKSKVQEIDFRLHNTRTGPIHCHSAQSAAPLDLLLYCWPPRQHDNCR